MAQTFKFSYLTLYLTDIRLSCKHILSKLDLLCCVIEPTPQRGFPVADYIKYYANFQPKLAIFTTIEFLLPEEFERLEKTHDFRQSVD